MSGRRRAQFAAAVSGLALLSALAEGAWLPWASLPGPDVRLNSVGYLPTQPKRATMVDSRTYGKPVLWWVHSCHWGVPEFGDRTFRCLADHERLHGVWTRARNSDAGRPAWVADFSALAETGTYILRAKREKRNHQVWSEPFNVSAGVLVSALRGALDGLYLARCGVAVGPIVAPIYDGDERESASFSHGACHTTDANATIDRRHTHANATDGHADVAGGWHDAGDYGKYTVNTALAVAHLLLADEHFGRAVDAALGRAPPGADASAPAGGSVGASLAHSRLLDEAMWGLRWLLTMQAADGAAYHKLSWPGFEPLQAMPEDDPAQGKSRYLAPASSAATAALAAVAAQGARAVGQADAALADACAAVAARAYAWLDAHAEPTRPAHGGESGLTTGAYDSHIASWEPGLRLWAAAELWETTGEARFHADALAQLAHFDARGAQCTWVGPASQAPPSAEQAAAALAENATHPPAHRNHTDTSVWCPVQPLHFDWSSLVNLGAARLALSARPSPLAHGGRRNAAVELRSLFGQVADAIGKSASAHPYGRPVGSYYHWGVNGLIARQALTLHIAQRALPTGGANASARARAAAFADGASLGLSHLLGANDFGRSYVTSVGWGAPRGPHHRPSMSQHRPWPYLLVGGPNPSALSWLDDKLNFRTNEVAINWQAALVYNLAMFAPGALAPEHVGSGGVEAAPAELRARRARPLPLTQQAARRDLGAPGAAVVGALLLLAALITGRHPRRRDVLL
jgi:endoglucanase